MPTRRKNPTSTSTSNFGVGYREGHDASAFYRRFRAPDLSTDDTVVAPAPVAEPFVHGDARSMDAVVDGSVALVVTSPPYFAGKQYEEELERDGVPASYLEYLELLRAVFAECVTKLEPGGRIAVNVANLGRKPYRSLSADVITILEDLGLLLRGELIWQKAQGATGSCAWGSFRSAANPVLRDLTERVIVASKGRFDRARTVRQREAEGLPHQNTMMTDDFMTLTLDVWSIPPESARRVGHPAPFPVELPEQLIRLYTYADDLVLDPFMGSGSALVAASRLGRRFVGYDTDADYVDIARRRVAELGQPMAEGEGEGEGDHEAGNGVDAPASDRVRPRKGRRPRPPVVDHTADQDLRQDAADTGKAATRLAEELLEAAGFTITTANKRIRRTGVAVSFAASDADDEPWLFDVAGAFTTHRPGLTRPDTVWRALGRAHALRIARGRAPLVVLTTALPRRSTEGDQALHAAGPDAVFDVVDLLSDAGRDRLARYATGGESGHPLPGFWSEAELARD